MKDYRTWWRKGFEAMSFIPLCGRCDISAMEFMKLVEDDEDCFREQLWAIREGLA